MKSLDEMSMNEAIALYYEKHHAMKQGDVAKLRELKAICPELFIKSKDSQIRHMIEYAKAFQKSDRYKELCRLEMKRKLTVVTSEPILES